jgi:hypothetical protein
MNTFIYIIVYQLSMILSHAGRKKKIFLYFLCHFCMQEGWTPAYVASLKGHNETLTLLLANKADINAATKVHQFELFNYL